jgi:hypothetical protein
VECFFEELRKEEEGGALIKTVATVGDNTAASTSEGVLFEDRNIEACFCKPGGCRDTSYARTL